MVAWQGRQTRKRIFFDYLQIFVVAVLLALLIRHFVIEAYRIPADAMVPTLYPGDYIFVNKLSYFSTIPFTDKRLTNVTPPKRGDVIVFVSPVERGKKYIKRVIGLAGDTISMKDKQWLLNGTSLDGKLLGRFQYVEPLSQTEVRGELQQRQLDGRKFQVFESFQMLAATNEALLKEPLVVPSDAVFVLGDNIHVSIDSRHFGVVPIMNIKGKAMFVGLSWEEGHKLPRWSRFAQPIR